MTFDEWFDFMLVTYGWTRENFNSAEIANMRYTWESALKYGKKE